MASFRFGVPPTHNGTYARPGWSAILRAAQRPLMEFLLSRELPTPTPTERSARFFCPYARIRAASVSRSSSADCNIDLTVAGHHCRPPSAVRTPWEFRSSARVGSSSHGGFDIS